MNGRFTIFGEAEGKSDTLEQKKGKKSEAARAARKKRICALSSIGRLHA